jgi:hypothetical protein
VVEWLNVTGGIDAAPDWLFLHRHLMREGAAWVGVSVQKAGIDGGGMVPGTPLKKANTERYGALEHPGDAFAFGIFSEIGRVLRTPKSGPLGPLEPQRLIAIGESQSAGFLVSYVNAVDAMERCYDAFLIHGRPGSAAGLNGDYIRTPRDGDLSNVGPHLKQGHRVREDARVPVLTLQSETDVVTLGGSRARQPDSERFRLWELAGAAHFDTYGLIATHVDREDVAVEKLAARMAPTDRPMAATLSGSTSGSVARNSAERISSHVISPAHEVPSKKRLDASFCWSWYSAADLSRWSRSRFLVLTSSLRSSRCPRSLQNSASITNTTYPRFASSSPKKRPP